MTKMINNNDNFVRLYKSQGLTLKACPHCGNLLQHQFYPGVMARVFCPFGCGSAVVAPIVDFLKEEFLLSFRRINKISEINWKGLHFRII